MSTTTVEPATEAEELPPPPADDEDIPVPPGAARSLLNSLLGPHRARITVAMLVILVQQAALQAGPLLVAIAMDRGIPALREHDGGPLIAVIAVGVYQPDLLPGAIRPKPRTQVVEVKTPSAPTPRSAQYVAVLQKEGGSPAFILTVDAATRNFTVRKVGASAEPGKSFELWLISDKLQRPRSLGVIGNGDFTARPVLASYDNDVINNATYAVTVEQAGGSPDGMPHSAPIFTGKLIETVPAR